MKRQLKCTEKSLWQEFCDFLAAIYWPMAEDGLPRETVEWEYKAFLDLMAH